jgi:RHS repeat-associated protein
MARSVSLLSLIVVSVVICAVSTATAVAGPPWTTTTAGSGRVADSVAGSGAQPPSWSTPLAMSVGTVSTVAGNSTSAVVDGTGSAASFQTPNGMSIVGGFGYLLDFGHIRKVDLATGAVTTITGGGIGCVDSTNPATAKVGNSWSNQLVNDGSYLYWMDKACPQSGGDRALMRRMSLATGAVSSLDTLASAVTVGPDGTIYVADTQQVSTVDPTTGVATPFATLPSDYVSNFGSPVVTGMAADGSALWITRLASNLCCHLGYIDKVDLSSASASNFYAQQLDSDLDPGGPVVSAGPDLYIATPDRQVVQVDKFSGAWVGVAGAASAGHIDGTGTEAWLSGATGIDTDGTRLWLTDGTYVRAVVAGTPLPADQPPSWTSTTSMSVGAVSTVAGNSNAAVVDGTGQAASFANPVGLSIVGGFGYVIDNGYIRRITLATGAVTTLTGGGQGCANSANPAQVKTGGAWHGGLVNDGTYLYWLDGACANGYDGALRRMSLATGAVSYVGFGPHGQAVTIGPDGTIYLASHTDVSAVNPMFGTEAQVASLPADVPPPCCNFTTQGMTADGTALWIVRTAGTAGAIDKVDLATATASTFDTEPQNGSLASATGPMASAGQYLYLGTNIYILGIDKNSPGYVWKVAGGATTVPTDGVGTGAGLSPVAGLDSDGTSLWFDGGILVRRIDAGQPASGLPREPAAPYPAAGIGPQEIPGEANASELCACGVGQGSSYPVNTATGTFWHSFTDLATPGRGIPLMLRRTYVSANAASDGMFGHGWSSSYDTHLTLDPATGEVSVHQSDGSQVAFVPTGDGGFSPIQPRILATLSEDANGVYTFVRERRLTMKFSSAGLLTSISDLSGNATTLGYDDHNRLHTVTDPSGRTYLFAYSDPDTSHASSVTDDAGRSVRYSYTNGDLTSVTDPTGKTWTFGYDANHRLTTMLDPAQQSSANPTLLTNAYDATGRVTAQSDFDGNTTTFDYTSIAGATKITSPEGRVTVDYYTNGLRTKTTVGYGTSDAITTSYGYDPTVEGVNAATETINGHAVTTHIDYDARGNVTKVTDPLGRTTSYGYDNLNDQTSVTDNHGTTTTRSFDDAGNLDDVSTPLTSSSGSALGTIETVYHHDDPSHPDDITSVRDPNQHTTSYDYDRYGDLIDATTPATTDNPNGSTVSYGYNTATGWLTSVTTPRGNVSGATKADYTTSYTYNDAGDLRTITTPDQQTTDRTYDDDHRLNTTTAATGKQTVLTYDLDGRELSVQAPGGSCAPATRVHCTSYTYDKDGNQLTSVNGNGTAITTNTYTAAGQLASTTDALAHTTNYTYDSAGNIATVTAPNGSCTSPTPTGCTTNTYNDDGELTGVTYTDGTPAISYSYDDLGRIDIMSDGTGTSSWDYDSAGRVEQHTDGSGATVGYSYDLAGNRTAITYPNTKTVSYTYNAANQLSAITDWNQHTTTLARNADGAVHAETYPNGLVATTDYDHQGATQAITDTLGSSTSAAFTYGRNDDGLVTSLAQTGLPQGNRSYDYDAADELTTDTAPTPNYSYDGTGNPTTLPSSTQTFNAAQQLTTSTTTSTSTTNTYSYDTRGNRTGSTSPAAAQTLFATNLAGQLTSATTSGTSDAPAPGGYYAYTGHGNVYNSTAATWYGGNGTVTNMVGMAVTPDGGGYWLVGSDGVQYPHGDAPDLGTTATSFAHPIAGIVPTPQGGFFLYTNHGDVYKSASKATMYGANPQITTIVGMAVTPDGKGYWLVGSDGTRYLHGDATDPGTTVTSYAHPIAGIVATPNGGYYLYTGHGDVYASTNNTWLGGNATVAGIVGMALTPDAKGYWLIGSDGTRYPHGDATDPGTTATTYAHPIIGITTAPNTTNYTYDGTGLRTDATNQSATTHFTYDTSGALPLVLSDGTNNYIYGPNGNPIEQINISTGATRYLSTDALGSTRLVTDDGGTTVASYSYDAYGNTTNKTGTATTPLRYAGQYYDTTTGLYWMRARYYDPTTAQFLTVDPLVQTTNQPYSYANNNPTNTTDPTGLCGWECVYSALEGFANGITGGAVAYIDELISPGSTCTYDHDGVFDTFSYLGMGAQIALTAGAGLEVDAAAAGAETTETLAADTAGDGYPAIKAGSSGGPTAGQKFPASVRQEELGNNPSTCVYCHMDTDSPQVDHVIPRSRGGNATVDNAQTTCAHCNASKGARDFPVTPPGGYEGPWPPPWWGSGP